MSGTVKTFEFTQAGLEMMKSEPKGSDWPVVYFLFNKSKLYIGETTSVSRRIEQHLHDPKKQEYDFLVIDVIFDDTFNKSVILDYEQKLIKCCAADHMREIINKNNGQSASHEYYNRNDYTNRFNELWQMLINNGLAQQSLDDLENQNIFKYSPYNALTEEQNAISVDIINDICNKLETHPEAPLGISLVNGCAGTGKTVLAISIINSLVNAVNLDESELTEEQMDSDKVKAVIRLKHFIKSPLGHPLKIGFVFPMSGIRETIEKVFKESGKGLKKEMVISPYDLGEQEYDILFVDESHRLFQRRNLPNYPMFDAVQKKLNLPQSATQLDWILKRGSYNVLFYDEDQSIKGSDITPQQYKSSLVNSGKTIKHFELTTQMRCLGGSSYTKYIKNIMECQAREFQEVNNFKFRLFNNVDNMVEEIKSLNTKFGLCRTMAGYSWEWKTKPKDTKRTYEEIVASGEYDIDIQGHHYIWNLETKDWIGRKDSVDTIGCIHTTQGFDLNYAGIIFGEEIDYDPKLMCISIDLSKFFDRYVKNNNDEITVKKYIINTYTTMLARGIHGCYVYACNPNLQKYLQTFIRRWSPTDSKI
jgi:DUF2075 family protein/predicted GIY-YIG superfamily endonuclease